MRGVSKGQRRVERDLKAARERYAWGMGGKAVPRVRVVNQASKPNHAEWERYAVSRDFWSRVKPKG